MDSWNGKIVVVTGGSSGLGRAIATAFAARKARVVIAARDRQKLDQTARDLAQKGFDVTGIEADVTRQESVDALVAGAIERFGRLDVLVNNAGRSARGAVLDTTPEDFEELLKLNLIGVVRCTRAAAPHLLARRGHLVNIGSLAGKSATRYMGAYPASKFALSAYTAQLRLELEPRGLHVLLVCPGPIARDEPRREPLARSGDSSDLPDAANKPGAGVKLNLLRPEYLAERIVRACERRQPEIVVPGRARLLVALAALWPRLGDWVLRRVTG
ncbi:MAG: SDR family NAD(P)-dependent oxidoreductase [Planctomycetia bacterium]|nr:SDR family NAD(P)-dependent oxidoreductase [Planctomycetia bacterium]